MWLVVYRSDTADTPLVSVPLPEGPFVVGRGPDCDVALHDGAVAKRHLRLERLGDEIHFHCLEKVPTIVCNGVPLATGSLTPDDELRIGSLKLVLAPRPPPSSE